MAPSNIVWGNYTLPMPNRDGTGQLEVIPVGSISEGPEGDIFGVKLGYRNQVTYNWVNLSETEKGTIETAYRANAFTPTSLTLLTGTSITVTAAQRPLAFAVFYDRQHVPHYATSITFRTAALS